MAEIKDGGPAFPTKHPAQDPRASGFFTEDGMTLRDYFAAKAMQAALISGRAAKESDVPWFLDEVARLSYAAADAMLRAREVNHG